MAKLPYNTTQLDPKETFERHVFHRDQFAHYLRWSFILNVMPKVGGRIVDFGCGTGNLCEVLYRNRYRPKAYQGIDLKGSSISKAQDNFGHLEWAQFFTADLVKTTPEKLRAAGIQGDRVVSFEVLEHVGQNNAEDYLRNLLSIGTEDATYYLSTPNYDPSVGAAGNHTYDSGDGRGVVPQEWDHYELQSLLQNTFQIVEKFGTFASIKDYKPFMNEHQEWMFDQLRKYYDTNLISVIMAPMFPEKSRNTLWILRRKE